MSVYFNPQHVLKIKGYPLIIDTNILSSCFSDEAFFKHFTDIFKDNYMLIDPIVKLEFLRGEFQENFYQEKNKFISLNQFYVTDESPTFQDEIYINTFNISRIYSHQGNSKIPLGDIFIIARLMSFHATHLFITQDKKDFSTFLFDRVTVLSFEKKAIVGSKRRSILEHLTILKFNYNKYKQCLGKLPN